MAELLEKVDIMKHEGLAKQWVRKYSTVAKMLGYDSDDVYQTAMMALHKASETYKPELGSFTTHATYKLRDDLNDLVYKRKTVNGKTKRILKKTEIPFAEMTYEDDTGEEIIPVLDDYCTDPEEDDSIRFVREFLENLTLTQAGHKRIFLDTLFFTKSVACKMYMKRTGKGKDVFYKKLKEATEAVKVRYINKVNMPVGKRYQSERKVSPKSESGVKGITKTSSGKYWRVRYYDRDIRKTIFLGKRKDLEEAKKLLSDYLEGKQTKAT